MSLPALIGGVGAANTAAGNADQFRVSADAAYKLGTLDGCAVLVQDAANGVETDDRHRRGLESLTGASDAGDASACDAVPGRRLDPALLSAAHAYDACAQLGCRGDVAAARLARDHGVIINCRRQP